MPDYALSHHSAIAYRPVLTSADHMQIASEGLKGRVFECNLADLQSVSFTPHPAPALHPAAPQAH